MRKGLTEQPSLIDLPAPAGAEGHRRRLRQRLLAAGPDSLNDQDLLEFILFLALPRRDTKSIAKQLLARFGSFAKVIAAPVAELRGIGHMKDSGPAALKLVPAAARRLTQPEAIDRHVLNNWDRLMDYLHTTPADGQATRLRALFLDTRNRLLADEAPVSPSTVVTRALELRATALILVHHTPGSDLAPSREDIDMTRHLRQAAGVLNIVLHDHIILGSRGWLSFRREGLL